MRLDLDRPAGINMIDAVSAGEVRIGDRVLRASVIVGIRDIIPDWPVASTGDIDDESLAPLMALGPEIVLLGTGERLVFPPRYVYGRILSRKVGLEVMDTAAACRTFNILAAEGRQVVAGLIIDRSQSNKESSESP